MSMSPMMESLRSALGTLTEKERNPAVHVLTSFLHKLQVEQEVRIADRDEIANADEIGVYCLANMRGWVIYFSDGENAVSMSIVRDVIEVAKRTTRGTTYDLLSAEDIGMVKRLVNTLSNCDVHLVIARDVAYTPSRTLATDSVSL